MRSVLLIPAFSLLVACGAKPAPAPTVPASARIRPPLSEPPRPVEEEEEELPTPTLRVTKLTPTPVKSKTVSRSSRAAFEEDVVDDASIDEPGRRPLLSLQGDARDRRPEGASSGVESAEASSTWQSEGPRPSALDPAARASYKNAYRIYQEHKPREALDAFAAFVLKYPDHPYVEQATYWRGECYVALGDRAHALEQFRGVTARFPGTPKAREAEARIAALRGAEQGSSR